MSRALSVDLRGRVLAFVASGATHREAGDRFGVSAASVSRWRAREREQGDVRPKALGGDRKSGRIDAHKAAIGRCHGNGLWGAMAIDALFQQLPAEPPQ